jgi:hypothetical protein
MSPGGEPTSSMPGQSSPAIFQNKVIARGQWGSENCLLVRCKQCGLLDPIRGDAAGTKHHHDA